MSDSTSSGAPMVGGARTSPELAMARRRKRLAGTCDHCDQPWTRLMWEDGKLALACGAHWRGPASWRRKARGTPRTLKKLRGEG